jgi:hypothetical protein
MKVWIIEDSNRVAEELEGAITRHHSAVTIQILPNLEAAREAIEQMTDQDVVLLDSQLPLHHGGPPMAPQAGEEMVARIRARGLRSKLIWHSRTSLPEIAGSLGVQDMSHASTDGVAAHMFAEALTSKTLAPETWSNEGQQYLEKLTARQTPLSEFVPLSILCQGYLAIVGAAGLFPNEVADELKKSEIGRECIAQAHVHLGQALNYAEWFAAGREKISAAVKRGGAGEQAYWRGIGEEQAELEEVATIRRLYERMGEQGNPEAGEELHRLVADAHRSLQTLFARRYL